MARVPVRRRQPGPDRERRERPVESRPALLDETSEALLRELADQLQEPPAAVLKSLLREVLSLDVGIDAVQI